MAKRKLGTHFLKQWREHKGLSLRKLASMMEAEPGVELMSHANIGRIENMQQPYSQEILEAAAEALNCTVLDLLTIDPTVQGYTDRSPDAQLRSALLAIGVDGKELRRAVRTIKVGFVKSEELSEPAPLDDQSEPSSRRRVKVPSQ